MIYSDVFNRPLGFLLENRKSPEIGNACFGNNTGVTKFNINYSIINKIKSEKTKNVLPHNNGIEFRSPMRCYRQTFFFLFL